MGRHDRSHIQADCLEDLTPPTLTGCEFTIVLRRDEIPVLEIGGELDMLTAPAMTTVATPVLEAAAKIILDLEAVTFLASYGLSALVRLREVAQQNGQGCAIVANNEAVLRPVAITGLTPVLDPYPSVREAHKRLRDL